MDSLHVVGDWDQTGWIAGIQSAVDEPKPAVAERIGCIGLMKSYLECSHHGWARAHVCIQDWAGMRRGKVVVARHGGYGRGNRPPR